MQLKCKCSGLPKPEIVPLVTLETKPEIDSEDVSEGEFEVADKAIPINNKVFKDSLIAYIPNTSYVAVKPATMTQELPLAIFSIYKLPSILDYHFRRFSCKCSNLLGSVILKASSKLVFNGVKI